MPSRLASTAITVCLAHCVTAVMGGVFMLMTFAVFVLYGVFAAAARTWLLGSEQVMCWLNRSFAALFAALAGRLALERA